MADHKNQHFVPRVLLRPFTKDAEDKSINLYNIRSDRLIPDAPVKGQCARHYWYGEDGQLELLLGKLEGMFGLARQRVVGGGNSDKDREETSLFMCMQLWRTANAAARLRHWIEQTNANSWGPEEPVPDDKKLVISAMRLAIKSRELLKDLKIRFVENHTSRDFIIADDPAVLLNRFATEKLGGSAFGVASSGLIFVMPMSPRLSVICYDGLVYSLDATNGRAILKSEVAIDAYNEIQCIAAEENIYFQRWKDGDYVRQRFAAVKHKRRPAATAYTFVPDGETENAEHYRLGTVEEGRAAKRSLVATRFNYPEPDRWIPGLRYRPKPTTFFNGTGMGHVRKREWLYRGREEPPPDQGEKMQIIRTGLRPNAWTRR
ncbi:DUF4238 domain-containing protein [Rhodopseudomonas sp. P1]|uniref:DUF4238 domain-containing protein n=1 Tax=Rhodopseudomonas sp. P1 TaxID=3434357 RepID=UPI0031FBAF2B